MCERFSLPYNQEIKYKLEWTWFTKTNDEKHFALLMLSKEVMNDFISNEALCKIQFII